MDNPASTLLVFLLGALLALAAGWQTGQPAAALMVAVLLLVPLHGLVLPVRYEVNANGLERHGVFARRRIAWRQIDCYQITSERVEVRLKAAEFSWTAPLEIEMPLNPRRQQDPSAPRAEELAEAFASRLASRDG